MADNQLFADWVTGDLITAAKLNQMKNDVIPWSQAGVAGGVANLNAAGMPLTAAGEAVVEYGSNTAGSYVRLADGTQICWVTATRTANALSAAGAWGTVYYLSYAWTFPAPFIAAPTVVAHTVPANTFLPTGNKASDVTATNATVWCWAADNFAAATYNIVAIGRWK